MCWSFPEGDRARIQVPHRIMGSLCTRTNKTAMKHILSSIVLAAASLVAHAQKVDAGRVPQAVRSAFAVKFPGVANINWEMEDKKDYEANFTRGGAEWSATFTPAGAWLETEHKLAAKDLPAAVHKGIAANYPGHELKEAEQTDTPMGTFYEVELTKAGSKYEVVFTAEGSVMKAKDEGRKRGEKDEDND